MDLLLTDHAIMRMQMRNIAEAHVRLAFDYGRLFYQGQYRLYVIGRREIHASQGLIDEKLDGLHVIATGQDVVVTTYRAPAFREKGFTPRSKRRRRSS